MSAYNLRLKKVEDKASHCYEALSGGEKDLLIIDLLISKAREICKERLTLLLIDDLAYNLDQSNFEILLRALAKEDFQSIVSLPPAKEREIITYKENNPSLNDLDYLREWCLAVLASSESVP
jgi:recombinational DNA repair ATPase RecF